MNARTVTILGLALLGLALLAPYVGVHLLTARPTEEISSKPNRELNRRRLSGAANDGGTGSTTPAPPRRAPTGERQDLRDIEDILGAGEP